METKLIRVGKVVEMTGIPKSSLYLKIKKNEFPKPVMTGVRTRAWRMDSVIDWINSRPEVSTEDVYEQG